MNLEPFLPQEPQYDFDRTKPEDLVRLAEAMVSDEACHAALKRVGCREDLTCEDFTKDEEKAIGGFIHTYVKDHGLERIFHLNTLVSMALARLLVHGHYEIGSKEALVFATAKCCPKRNSANGWTDKDWLVPTIGDVLVVARDLERRPWVIDIFERGLSEPKTEREKQKFDKMVEEIRKAVGDEIADRSATNPVTEQEWQKIEQLLHYFLPWKYGLVGPMLLVPSPVRWSLRYVYQVSGWSRGVIPRFKTLDDSDMFGYFKTRPMTHGGFKEGDYA